MGFVEFGVLMSATLMGRQRIAELLRSRSITLDGGSQLHAVVVKMGYASDLRINNDLISMYGKSGRLRIASKVFDEMPERNVVTWTALMVGSLQQGDAEESLKLLRDMIFSGIEPNEFSFSTALKACGFLGCHQIGCQIHGRCAKIGFLKHQFVGNTIVYMYSRSGRNNEAMLFFNDLQIKDLIAWNAMISGFAGVGNGRKSLLLFQEMKGKGEELDEFTFSSLLRACSGLNAIHEGTQIHSSLITSGIPSSYNTILSGALIDFYVKCQNTKVARKVFDMTQQKSSAHWTSLIIGYAQEGLLKEAMDMLRQLWSSGIIIDPCVICAAISVFADFSLVEQGKQVHSYTVKDPSGLYIRVGNSLIDMYCKCGLIEEAELYFRDMQMRSVVSWTVMINGYGKHGDSKSAIALFEKLPYEGLEADNVTYLALLSACGHAGMVEESKYYFSLLLKTPQIKANFDHYACMVDLLGRAGQLHEAKHLIETMPLEATASIWQTLLGACRVHRDLKMGKEVGEILLRMDGDNPVNYVMMSNIFAEAGEWGKYETIREEMKRKKLKKQGGCSWMEIGKQVHLFYGCDDSHPLTDRIHQVLKELERRMQEEIGYVSCVRFAMRDVEEESKEESLRVHGEKLAVGLWLLINGMERRQWEIIRVYKNLRVCGDCHEFMKGVSKVTGRVLMIRDATRFHRFEKGACSCRDYW